MGRTENRAKKRDAEKNMKKHKKTLAKLTPDELALIDLLATQKMNNELTATLVSYERVINASLIEHGFNYKEITSIIGLAASLASEENKKSKKING